MRSPTRTRFEDDRAFVETITRARRARRFSERNRGTDLGRAEPHASGWHPLEFDESGFPVPQRPASLPARLRRLVED